MSFAFAIPTIDADPVAAGVAVAAVVACALLLARKSW
jgi:hypothetical protein